VFAAASPSVTNVLPQSGTVSGNITVIGTGLTPDTAITIGGLACSTTRITYRNATVETSDSPDLQGLVSTVMTCQVPSLPVGDYSVSANVPGIGFATGTFTYTYTATVLSASPRSGSLEGGQVLTILGSGFNHTNPEENLVFLGPLPCAVTTASSSQIQCVAPQRNGFIGQWYDIGTPLGPYMPNLEIRTPDIVRSESVLFYGNGQSGFWPGLDARFATRFAARFTGSIYVPTTGNYTVSRDRPFVIGFFWNLEQGR
jgi:hypothetical protein